MAAFDAASGAERAAAESLAAARALDDLRTRGRRAVARLEGLDAARPSHVERVAPRSRRPNGRPRWRVTSRRSTGLPTTCRPAVVRSSAPARPCHPAALDRRLPDADVADVLARLSALDGTAAALARESDDEAHRARRRAELDDRAGAAHGPGRAHRGRARRGRAAARAAHRRARGAGRRGRPGARARAAARRPPGPGSRVLDAAEHDLARADDLAPHHADAARPPRSIAAASCSTCASAGSTAWRPSSPARCPTGTRARCAGASSTPLPQRWPTRCFPTTSRGRASARCRRGRAALARDPRSRRCAPAPAPGWPASTGPTARPSTTRWSRATVALASARADAAARAELDARLQVVGRRRRGAPHHRGRHHGAPRGRRRPRSTS